MKEKIQPKTKEDLQDIVGQEIQKYGNECDLNHIDTSLITDMNRLFLKSDFNQDVNSWKPYKLKYALYMYVNCSAPIAYWSQEMTKEDRIKSIEAYLLAEKLEKKLEENQSLNTLFKL